jgi:RHS repeat-associated protein
VDYPNGDTVTYGYDANGNHLTQMVNGVTSTATYDDADQLTDRDGTTSSYDANGNLTARGSDTFAWDWNDQLSSATVNGTTANYAYDGNGNRFSATTGGTTTSYLWDGSNGLPTLVDDGTNAYLSPDGVQAAIDGSGTTSYPLDDALGSVRGLTDSSGGLTGSTDYDAFGAVRAQTGSTLPLGFTGELTDPTTGFLDLRARDLDPALGRFLSRDSVSPNAPGSQGYNPYAYVANNPTTWVDPSGHKSEAAAETFRLLLAAFRIQQYQAPIIVGSALVAEGAPLQKVFGGVMLFLTAVACALVAPCSSLADFLETAIITYGSAAAVGAWNGTIDQLRTAAETYPQTHGATNLPDALLQDNVVQYTVPMPSTLPTTGDYPYVPPKNTPAGMAVKNNKGEYVDRDNNRWRWDPNKDEWDVQHDVRGSSDATHTNVSVKGGITHGDDNFPRNPARP